MVGRPLSSSLRKGNAKLIMFGSEASPTFLTPNSSLIFLLTIKFFMLKYTTVDMFIYIFYTKKEVVLCTQLPRYF